MPHRTRLMMAVVSLAALMAASSLHAETYDLDTDHTAVVGDRYIIEGQAHNTEDSKQFADGQMFTEEAASIEITLVGEIEVLEINDESQASRIALTPTNCDVLINGREVLLALDKRVLAIQTPTGVVYEYENGGAVGEEPSAAIDLILGKLIGAEGDDGGPMASAFRLDQPRAPGEAWEMDHNEMGTHFRDNAGIDYDEEDLESQVRFVAFGQANFGKGTFDQDLAVIEMRTNVSPFIFTGDFFPDFMSLEHSSMSITSDIGKSLDPRSRQGWFTLSFDMEFRAVGIVPEENAELIVEMKTQQYVTLTIRDVE